MGRITRTAERVIGERGKLLIPYFVAGDPNLVTTLQLMHTIVDKGADIIELGIPFSDPSSDGPVIQRSVERSLQGNTSLDDVLELANVALPAPTGQHLFGRHIQTDQPSTQTCRHALDEGRREVRDVLAAIA